MIFHDATLLEMARSRPADPRALLAKIRSTNRYTRMPPLGVSIPDAEGIALLERWTDSLSLPPEPAP